MQHLLSQFTIKDLLTYAALGITLWYNTWGGQKDRDNNQDKRLELHAQILTEQVVPSLKETNKALQEVQVQLAVTRAQLEELSKKTK